MEGGGLGKTKSERTLEPPGNYNAYRNTSGTQFTTIMLQGGQERHHVGKSMDSEASQQGSSLGSATYQLATLTSPYLVLSVPVSTSVKRGQNESIYVRHLEQSLAHSTYLVNVNLSLQFPF